MKKLQKSVRVMVAIMTMATSFLLTSCDVMLEVLDGMASGMAMGSSYGTSPMMFGGSTNNSYLLDPRYAMWQTQQQQAQMNQVQTQLINQTVKQTERDMAELNRVNQQLINLSMEQAKQGIVLQGGSSSDSGMDGNNNTYNGKMTPSQYEAAYRRYESSVKSYYNGLTAGGVRSQDSNGNIQGKTVGQMPGGSYVSMKQGMKNAQADMKRIRQEAAQYGVHIQQSQWETATAGY